MNFDFIKCGVFTPKIKVCDVEFNLNSIKEGILQAEKEEVKVLVFPELVLTGSTCGDLFNSNTLISRVKNAIIEIAEFSKDKNQIIFFGAPIEKDGLLYNASVCVSNGIILGIVPKMNLSIEEKRFFSNYGEGISHVLFGNLEEDLIPFGNSLIFVDEDKKSIKIGVEFSEELFALESNSINLVKGGANLIVCHSASPSYSTSDIEIVDLVKIISKKLNVGYIYSNAGEGESTTDYVFGGLSVISEVGEVIGASNEFVSGLTTADLDLSYIDYVKRTNLKDQKVKNKEGLISVGFFVDNDNYITNRTYAKYPFIIEGEEERLIRIQAEGLKKRIIHTNANKLVVGLSGGLDSTLALIIAVKAMELAGKTSKDVLAITMPCFGTSSRTFENSITLAKAFNVQLKKVDITKSVKRHLKDLNHPEDIHDAAYENAQARERTQILMDTANMVNGMVVGTGDLSELALGFATYNGDHMSMYSVNGSIPKTLVRHLVKYVANKGRGKYKSVLLDILDTPVSPELLPPSGEKINQVTEDIVGPYVLHDFFLYNFIEKGFTPKKIYQVAKNTFMGEFDKETILKWEKIFFRRFFTQQFKRSCLPDGVKVTKISMSPRGGLVMPSDALSKIWLEELENI